MQPWFISGLPDGGLFSDNKGCCHLQGDNFPDGASTVPSWDYACPLCCGQFPCRCLHQYNHLNPCRMCETCTEPGCVSFQQGHHFQGHIFCGHLLCRWYFPIASVAVCAYVALVIPLMNDAVAKLNSRRGYIEFSRWARLTRKTSQLWSKLVVLQCC